MFQIINPKTLSAKNAEKLYAFFNAQYQQSIDTWSKDSTYVFADGSRFSFSSNVVMRLRKEGKVGVRYEFVSDRLLGKGQFGMVYQVEGTFSISKDSFRFKEHGSNGKTRAIKIQHHNYRRPQHQALHEYYLSKKASHLAIKQPTFEKKGNNSVSYTVMNKLKGVELRKIIQADQLGNRTLTLKERIELSKALLIALKEQVTDNGIIHRDIKPENILVDMSTNPITVNIIDFGLSTNADHADGIFPGTPLYQAPEMWDQVSQSCKADVFSMARLIAELWHDKTILELETVGTSEHARNNAHNVSLHTLFTGISELDEKDRFIIRATLAGMFLADSNQRYSIEQAIKLFSQVGLKPAQNIDEEAIEVLPPANLVPTIEQNIENNAILTRYHTQSILRIEAILAQIKLLRKHEIDLINRDSVDVAEKLGRLATDIEEKMNQLKYMSLTNYNQSVEHYAADCQTLINNSKEDFANHRNINYIWANIALAIAGLGVVYLTAGVINLALTRGNDFLFFKETKTSSLVRSVEKNLDEMGQLMKQEQAPVSAVIKADI